MSDPTRSLNVTRSTSTAHRLVEYDGACSNVHGHNFDWDVTLQVSMEKTGSDNMPLDFKDVADLLDETDHAILLNEKDALVRSFADVGAVEEILGDVLLFEGDPTCELVSQWMADRFIEEFDCVRYAQVNVHETDKYGMEATSVDMPGPNGEGVNEDGE